MRILKLGKGAGPDGLSPEYIFYCGEVLKLWLKKIINCIVTLEEVPSYLMEGVVIPVHGKDPLKIKSYRGITLSSVLSKVLETILLLLQRLS